MRARLLAVHHRPPRRDLSSPLTTKQRPYILLKRELVGSVSSVLPLCGPTREGEARVGDCLAAVIDTLQQRATTRGIEASCFVTAWVGVVFRVRAASRRVEVLHGHGVADGNRASLLRVGLSSGSVVIYCDGLAQPQVLVVPMVKGRERERTKTLERSYSRHAAVLAHKSHRPPQPPCSTTSPKWRCSSMWRQFGGRNKHQV